MSTSGLKLDVKIRHWLQVSVANVLLGADLQARTTPLAFSTGPLAEISAAGVVSEGELNAANSAIDADSSVVSTLESNHVNGGESSLLTGNNTQEELSHTSAGPVNKNSPGPIPGGASINIISPDSRFPKTTVITVSELYNFSGFWR